MTIRKIGNGNLKNIKMSNKLGTTIINKKIGKLNTFENENRNKT